MPKRKLRISKTNVILAIFAVIVVILAGVAIHSLSPHTHYSPQFTELQTQEKALKLPKESRLDISDAGCKTYEIGGRECSRHIDLLFEDTSVRPTIQKSLARNGWTHLNIPNPDRDLPANTPVRFETYDVYAKNSPTGRLCAEIKTEFNANYKPSGPWAISLRMFDNTEDCNNYGR